MRVGVPVSGSGECQPFTLLAILYQYYTSVNEDRHVVEGRRSLIRLNSTIVDAGGLT